MAYWNFDQHNPSYDPHPPVDFVNSGGDNASPAESYARRLSILEMAHQDQMRVNNEQKITNFEFLVAHQDQMQVNHEQKITNSEFRVAHQDQLEVNHEQKLTNSELRVAHQDQLEVNHEQKVTNAKLRIDLADTKGIQRKRREESLDMYLEGQAYSLEGRKKAHALYKKVDSRVDAHHEKLEYLLKRIKDLEDHFAAQASAATTVAHATGTDDGPTPASASADDLMTFSTVTNDPEASIGPDGHPADTLAGSQQAKTPVPVKTMLSHVDPSVNMQHIAQHGKKAVRFQLGEASILQARDTLFSPVPPALGVTPQTHKIPSLAKSGTQKNAAALDKSKLSRLGEADHEDDKESEYSATVSSTPSLSGPPSQASLTKPTIAALQASSKMPNTPLAETPAESALVEPKTMNSKKTREWVLNSN